ncbi:MAG: PEFG-CTERM sorting domain-containing protein [Nitrosotalea sp.]
MNVIIVVGICLLMAFSCSNLVFAQKVLTNPNITATTDKSSYIFGDTIVISGTVKTVLQGNIMTIQILDPYSNLIQTAQGSVAQDGSYADAVEIAGTGWKSSGVYTVLVQYGSEVQTQTTFAFTATTAPINDTFQVQIPNNSQIFNVPYTIFGGSVTNMSVNALNPSLTVSILPVNYGTITLSLPRSLLDAKTSNGTDEPFTILIDGIQIIPQKEQVTSSDRTLSIQFLRGDKNIQIIGTSVTPQNNSTINTPSTNLTTSQQPSAQVTNMSKPISAVPEFPNGIIPFIAALIVMVVLTRTTFRQIIRT